MAGAFDFYVDESLLEQLLGGGASDSSKSRKDGKPKAAITPVGAMPVPTGAVEPARPDLTPEPLAAPENPSVALWHSADQLFAAGDFTGAASQYRDAANIAGSDPSDLSILSTLHYNTGVAWLQAQSFEPAVAAFTQAVAAASDSRSARLALGLAHLRLDHAPEAIAEFDHVLAVNAHDADALLGKIQALCSIQRFDEASSTCLIFRTQYPQDPAALEALLAIRAAQQDRDGVEQAAKDLVQLKPNATTALKVLVAIAIARQDFELAAGHCDTLTADGQECDLDGWLHAAATYQSAGQFEKAAIAAAQALALQPDSFDASVRYAESQQKLGNFEDARASYLKAIAQDPNSPDVLWNLSLVYESLGSQDEAVEVLTRAVQIRTDWQDASMRLAMLHSARGKFVEAAAVLEHCLMLRKDWPEALFQLGLVLHQLGQTGPAQETVLKALEARPDETSWLEYLERIALERDDALVALDCHEKLAELNIESPETVYNLGVVLQNDNEPELAAKCYVRALEQRPDFGLALLNLGHALRDLGREEEARACWSKAILLDPSLSAGYFG